MTETPKKPLPHPDDFMVVTVGLEFRAKLNPHAEDPPPFELTQLECTPGNEEVADYLESVVDAARERRLYAFMVQEFAESAVGAGDWIEKTVEEVLAEATAGDDDG